VRPRHKICHACHNIRCAIVHIRIAAAVATAALAAAAAGYIESCHSLVGVEDRARQHQQNICHACRNMT
jgi:hypothetical protein